MTTCGPVEWRALGRRCALAVGATAWCDGHLDDAAATLAWARRLPDDADDVVRLWWVATGEVRLDPSALALLRRRVALPGTTAEQPEQA